jgi:deoxyribonuclease-4
MADEWQRPCYLPPMQRLIGSHLSIAGGYYKAADAAGALGMATVQIFTKSSNQWRGKPLSDEDVRLWKEAVARNKIQSPCAHDSYLINLGSVNDELWNKSIDAFVVELERAEALGLAGLVTHPGAAGEAEEEEALARVVEAFNIINDRTAGFQVQTWLETTAGQGTTLGYRFDHLAYIINESQDPDRFGVCVDTCHIFAAGYPIGTPAEYKATMDEFDHIVGVDKIRAFHLNDSKKPLASRVDRHDHIGEGCLGLEPFRNLLNDSRFVNRPMYLETKKEERDGVEMDAVNLKTLLGLIKN